MKLNVNFNKQLKQLEHLIADNSPAILTALGVVGVAATSVLTWKATKEAEGVLASRKAAANAKRAVGEDYLESFTKAEVFSFTWKLYVLPVCSGVLTSGCIIAANRISAKRAAAIAGILALTQDNFKEYKEKAKEKLTGPQYKKIGDEVAMDRANRVWDKETPYIVPDGEAIFVEAHTMRQFPSTKHKILQAETNFNRAMMRSGEDAATLSDFYDLLGLEHTAVSDNVGWHVKDPLEIEFTVMETPEGKPAFVINYLHDPIFRPWSVG